MDILDQRLESQGLSANRFSEPRQVVHWMGCIQAQDDAMAKWGIGIRLPGSTLHTVDAAINSAQIIRTHMLRMTWHYVAAEDLRWILALTAGGMRNSMRSRLRQLGLSEELIAHSNMALVDALQGGRQATRAEVLDVLSRAGLPLEGNRASHLLGKAEIDGIICSGAVKDGKPTYTLLDEWIPKSEPISREEALAGLAHRYFSSRGPATLSDFAWWSGLSITQTRQALELAKQGLASTMLDSQEYWWADAKPISGSMVRDAVKEECYFLPAFDEYLISYKDRTAALLSGDFTRAVSSNGIFWPLIVIDGKVNGTWKRTVKKERVILEVRHFQQPGRSQLRQIEEAAGKYASFIGKEPEIKIQPGE
jgi:hypothetical protein